MRRAYESALLRVGLQPGQHELETVQHRSSRSYTHPHPCHSESVRVRAGAYQGQRVTSTVRTRVGAQQIRARD